MNNDACRSHIQCREIYYQFLQLVSLTSGGDVEHECQSFGGSIACTVDATFLCLLPETPGHPSGFVASRSPQDRVGQRVEECVPGCPQVNGPEYLVSTAEQDPRQ